MHSDFDNLFLGFILNSRVCQTPHKLVRCLTYLTSLKSKGKSGRLAFDILHDFITRVKWRVDISMF